MAIMASDTVKIVEVSPRDGLQNEPAIVPTVIKSELIHRLSQTGLQTIEATSFVSAKWIPQLADGVDIMAHLPKNNTITYPVLVPNVKGLDAAIASGAKEVAVFGSVSEGFSRRNINCSIAESLERFALVIRKAKSHGIRVRGYISCVIACPYDGYTKPAQVTALTKRLLDLGCYEISLGDTIGVGTPGEVEALLTDLFDNGVPKSSLAGHFHDTYGMGVANAIKAWQMGIRVFDASVGGLGGCPFAQGAKGNVATEDLVYAFNGLGVRTGVDLGALVDIGHWVSRAIGRENASRVGVALMAKKGQQQPNTTPLTPPPTPPPTSDEALIVNRVGSVLWLTLNRPKKGNVLSNDLIEAIVKNFESHETDTTLHSIVLTGHGKYFCTGMDLAATTSSSSRFESLRKIFEVINNTSKRTIALINGPCYGGGIGLAFCCDIRVALSTATFTLSEVKRGIAPATISKYVIREWGPAMAREAMITGRIVQPTELKSHGCVHAVVENLDEGHRVVEKYLEDLKTSAPGASADCKRLCNSVATESEETYTKVIASIFDGMMDKEEGKHGIDSFQKGTKLVDWEQYYKAKL